MDKLLRETMSISEADDSYRHNVRLTLHFEDMPEGLSDLDDEDMDVPDTVDIEYDIEVDFRSWGIKDLNVSLRGVLEFDLGIGGKSTPIKIDFAETPAEIVWLEGGGYAPAEVHVIISGKDGYSVKSVEVDFYYLKP